MNFFKRALLNIKAKKGRTFLLILVMSAIMLFVLAGLIIQNAATTAANDAKKSAGATVTLAANRDKAFSDMKASTSTKSKPSLNLAGVEVSTAKKIGVLSNVKSYSLTTSTTANASSFDAITTSDSNQGGMGGKEMKSAASTGDLTISGVSSTASALSSNGAKITKGRGLTASDLNTKNVVIETELASTNKISTGDTITMKSTNGTKYKVKVVGIYKASSISSANVGGPSANDPSNTIYTAYTFANTLKGSKYKGTVDSVVYTLSNPAKSADFTKAAKKLINTSKFSMSTNDSTYQSMLTPLNNVKSFAQKIVLLVAVAGTIILALIVILMIRERRYEIGVLLSLGEKRWKVIAQFFVEMVMVLIVSLVVAGVGGKFVGNVIGDQLISQQTTTATISSTSSDMQGGPGGNAEGGALSGTKGGPGGSAPSGTMGQVTKSEKLKNLSTTVSVKDLVELGGMGLVIIFISIMLASFGILRLEPKKILIS
ncbi:ABC transporter permease [Dellaglioa algida]|uniref:ABC transporter permease n=1 Tax=Dellaglioa algida TaxID=105612 RepID=A0A5C6MD34_9LACO|nr:ABC transporter permease [Dellaglioa algida]MDK1716003.1 ABC transporter permease [Dellaglioa algida]MDK1719284.1 ABC transporter permease [Dellaglioa algida]MDK1721214.1 ABC transporter permease [Dellaglioa algida]MDK1722627.1 ABC transporter permease [Dellaglioa algida]MDK1724246.1 ABC transporter permease [Dellaglioa algida]